MSRRPRPTRGPASRQAPYDPAPYNLVGADNARADNAPGRPVDGTPSLRERLATATVPAGALLPIRFFFGITFLYAGIDKLIDPAFFDASSPTSIMAQLVDFERVSPLAPLVKASEPFALLLGIGIALAEIGIGLGALTGLAYRVAAAGGAAISLLFFLTASWSTHPYYYGPDLPYAAGWIALALAGHGGFLVPRWVRDLGRFQPLSPGRDGSRRAGRGDGQTPRPASGWQAEEPTTLTRRTLLQVGVLAGAALAVGSVTLPFRMLRGSPAASGSGAGAGATPRPAASPFAASTAAPSAGSTGGLAVANVSDLQKTAAVPFTVPFDAPSSLPAGDPAVIVKLSDGTFVAYDTVCTHEGCTVEWDGADKVLLCPCHGAAFDPADNAKVLQGPTRQPLTALPITVDAATGTISLQA
jgi:thiosulfate dehydrogenase (quinone) large subunit